VQVATLFTILRALGQQLSKKFYLLDDKEKIDEVQGTFNKYFNLKVKELERDKFYSRIQWAGESFESFHKLLTFKT